MMEEGAMDNFSKLMQDITIAYRKKVGIVNLPMDQVAHSIAHLALEVFQKEVKENGKEAAFFDALHGRR